MRPRDVIRNPHCETNSFCATGIPTFRSTGEYHVRGINDGRKANMGDAYVVFMWWQGLDDAEGTWEPVSSVLKDAPTVLRRQLRKIKPPTAIKRELYRRCKINI